LLSPQKESPLDGEWLSIFGSGFGLRCFQPLSSDSVAARRCLVRQPVHQRLQRPVPLVLRTLSPQTACIPSR